MQLLTLAPFLAAFAAPAGPRIDSGAICGILPCTRFEVIDDCGHCACIERPDIFFGHIKAFARERSIACQGT